MKIFFAFFCVMVFTGFIFVSTLGSSISQQEIKTKPVPLPKIGEGPAKRIILVHATAYGPPKFPKGQATYSGKPVGPYVIAGNLNDPNIPFNSRLKIEGFKGEFHFCDTGVPVGHVDIWLPTAKMVDDFGKQILFVEVLKDKSS